MTNQQTPRAVTTTAEEIEVVGRNAKKRIVARTIRVDLEVDSQLEEKAAEDRLSVNTVIANALNNYVDWTRHGEKIRNATVPITLLRKMMEYLTIEESRKLGEWYGVNAFVELVNSLFGRVRFTSVLATLVLMSRYSGLFELEHDYVRTRHHLRMHHIGGPKWAQFYENFLRTVFTKTSSGPLEISSTENMVNVSVTEPTADSPVSFQRK